MASADLRIASAFNQIDPTGMKWRGSWGIVGVYQQDEVVLGPDNESYICIDPAGSIGENPSTNPAVWQLLSSGTATAVSVSTSNGSGITVAEPTPNNFTVATNLVAGSGIGFTPSGINTSLSIANTGVLGVGGGTGILVGGTAQNPSIANAGVTSLAAAPGSGLSVNFSTGDIQINKVYPSQSQIVDTRLTGGLPATGATPPGGAVTLVFNLPVVAGGLYTITAAFGVTSTASSAGSMSLSIGPAAGVAPSGTQYFLLSDTESTLTKGSSAAVTFTVPPGVTQYGVFVQGGAGAVGSINASINSFYLTRWA